MEDKIKKEIIKKIRDGKGLTGKEGALTPLLKELIEAAIEGEMDEHLKETKEDSNNRRNGHTQKNLKSSLGAFEISTPRDREGSFRPRTVEKRQRVLPGDLDEKILSLYSHGMSYRDIRSQIEEIYGVEVSDGTISSITDRIIPVIREWQSRPLERIYPIIWMDAMHFKIRDEGQVKTKAIYTVLGVNMDGYKEVLGLYQGESESSSFWLQILSDLNQRGVKDILIASIDNLRGFADAIENIFPNTEVQLCVIHQIRNSLKYVTWKNQRAFMKDLKKVYKANTKELAEHHLDEMEDKWVKQYPIVFKSWRTNWDRLSNYFKYPEPIRKLIYTTNTVEGYHRMVRKVTKSKGAFTSELAAMKLIYLATVNFQKKWQKRIYDWTNIYNQLSIYYEERLNKNDTLK
ncbi:MAG: IS256 family transposase [Bacteroidota bacterium]